MHKLVAGAAAVLAAGVIAVGLALPASAATTGPDSPACATANAAVLTAAIEANQAAEQVGDQQDVVLVGLKKAVKVASDKVDATNDIYQKAAAAAAADPTDEAKQKAAADALEDLVAAQAELKKATEALAAGPALTPAQKAKLDAANKAVADAIARRKTACDEVPPVTATPSPTVTVTVTPSPTRVPVPVEINTGYSPQL